MALLLLDQPFHTAAFGAAVLFTLVLAKWVLATLRPRDFPPGPPIIPGLGNLHQMPIAKPYLKFHEWSKQYGEVVGLKIGTGNLVLLNTPDLVHELFDKRGAICSNRPVNHIMTKYVHSEPEEKGIAILQYDDYYRRWRKSFQFILGAAGIKRLLPLLEAEASSLCQKFLNGSKDFEQCCRHWALAVPLVATTGERLDDKPSNYADNVLHAQEELLSLILPGAAPPVDVLPFLKYIPEVLASWKSRARAVRKYMVDDASEYLIGAKKTYRQITENPASVGFDSLLPKIMEEQANGNTKEIFTDTELAYIGQAAVGAAVDTTLATFKSLMIAFAAFPEKLVKAQEEIDRLTPDGPLSGSRIGELKYLRACISEVHSALPPTSHDDLNINGNRYFGGVPRHHKLFLTSLPRMSALVSMRSLQAPCLSPTPGPFTATKRSTTALTNSYLSAFWTTNLAYGQSVRPATVAEHYTPLAPGVVNVPGRISQLQLYC